MNKKLYSLIAIFLSCFSSTYLSYIFAYAFYTVRRVDEMNTMSPFSLSVTNVLWPSALSSSLALLCCWLAYKKQQGLRSIALVLSIVVLLATLFFQHLLMLVLSFY